MSQQQSNELLGTVVAGFGGFYQVRLDDGLLVECHGRGKLKQKHSKILTGDAVRISLVEQAESCAAGANLGIPNEMSKDMPDEMPKGMIEEIFPRRNQLQRPHIANIDQVVIVLAWHLPDYDLLLLDRMLLMCELAGVQAIICFNKIDLMQPDEQEQLQQIKAAYAAADCQVLALSAERDAGLQQLRPFLAGKRSVLAGPSGVGKTSMLNLLLPTEQAQTGAVSQRLQRGRHTTRYVRLLMLPGDEQGGMIADTPGFFVLDVPAALKRQELAHYYPDFLRLQQEQGCRFDSCCHHHEPDCLVKQALQQGELDEGRYRRYLRLLQEIEEREVKY